MLTGIACVRLLGYHSFDRDIPLDLLSADMVARMHVRNSHPGGLNQLDPVPVIQSSEPTQGQKTPPAPSATSSTRSVPPSLLFLFFTEENVLVTCSSRVEIHKRCLREGTSIHDMRGIHSACRAFIPSGMLQSSSLLDAQEHLQMYECQKASTPMNARSRRFQATFKSEQVRTDRQTSPPGGIQAQHHLTASFVLLVWM
jgi:hypothetical protein